MTSGPAAVTQPHIRSNGCREAPSQKCGKAFPKHVTVFDVTEVVCGTYWSIFRVCAHHIVPPDVWYAHGRVYSTLHGRHTHGTLTWTLTFMTRICQIWATWDWLTANILRHIVPSEGPLPITHTMAAALSSWNAPIRCQGRVVTRQTRKICRYTLSQCEREYSQYVHAINI